jgi:endonuclease YncB( thermonuclease family)
MAKSTRRADPKENPAAANPAAKSTSAPFPRGLILSVLAFVLAAGGYGGYQVTQTHGKYGAGFDNRPHAVEEVVDGDTIVLEDGVRVRLLGLDAPEQGACFADQSKQGLQEMVLGRQVILEKDQTAKDNYDRLLRYVFIYEDNPETDQAFLNRELVRAGLALSQYVKPNRRYLQQLQAAEREAETQKLGLWSACDPSANRAEPQREEASDPYSEECVIKGNINKRYEKDYFLPGCPNYKRVKVDPRKGEQWFCTEEEAAQAGWQRSASCENLRQFQEGA